MDESVVENSLVVIWRGCWLCLKQVNLLLSLSSALSLLWLSSRFSFWGLFYPECCQFPLFHFHSCRTIIQPPTFCSTLQSAKKSTLIGGFRIQTDFQVGFKVVAQPTVKPETHHEIKLNSKVENRQTNFKVALSPAWFKKERKSFQ